MSQIQSLESDHTYTLDVREKADEYRLKNNILYDLPESVFDVFVGCGSLLITILEKHKGKIHSEITEQDIIDIIRTCFQLARNIYCDNDQDCIKYVKIHTKKTYKRTPHMYHNMLDGPLLIKSLENIGTDTYSEVISLLYMIHEKANNIHTYSKSFLKTNCMEDLTDIVNKSSYVLTYTFDLIMFVEDMYDKMSETNIRLLGAYVELCCVTSFTLLISKTPEIHRDSLIYAVDKFANH